MRINPNQLPAQDLRDQIKGRIILLIFFPLVGYVTQRFNPSQALIPESFYFKYTIINKLPAFTMILYVLAIALVPISQRIIKNTSIMSFVLIPVFFSYLAILDKRILIYGAADKPILYSNWIYFVLAGLILSVIVRSPAKQFLLPSKIGSYFFGGIAFLSISYVCTFVIFDLRHPYNGNYLNWMVVLNPIIQSSFGKTIFVDQYSQYGGYGLFFKPIFALIDPSVFKITLILSILLGVGFYLLYHISTRLFSNYFFALIILFSSLYLGLYAFALWPGEKYFQVTPIRTFFPMLMIFVVFQSLNLKPNTRLILYSAGAILGVFWNLETGLVIFAALLLQVMYLSTGVKNLIREVFLYLAYCLLSFSTLVLILNLISKDSFDIELFVRPLLIYGAGGQLLFNKTWILVFFIFGVGLITALVRRDEKSNKRFDLLFFVSFLGFGLLLYHLLRENQHDATLSICAWIIPLVVGMILNSSSYVDLRISKSLSKVKKKSSQKSAYVASKTVDAMRVIEIENSLSKTSKSFRTINKVSHEIMLSIPMFLLIFLSLCFHGIQQSTPVTSEARIWEFGDSTSGKGLYANQDEGGLQYVTISEQEAGAKSAWEIRSEFAASFKKEKISADLLVLSEFDALMYLAAKSSTPAPWANWRHSGVITIPAISDYEFEHDVVLEQLKSGEIQSVILDQYTGNMLSPFAVHTACNGCDEKLLSYIEENFTLQKSADGGPIYNYYLKTGPGWSNSMLSYWIRKQ